MSAAPSFRIPLHMRLRIAIACSILSAVSSAQCPPAIGGPDVIAGEISSIQYWGNVGGVGGYSLGATACNIGDTNLPWNGVTDMHPVLAQNMYRLLGGRMQQVGMSFVAHGHSAIGQQVCCPCTPSGSLSLLGAGCSNDTTGSLNGSQEGSGTVGGLGPRSEVDAVTGVFSFPYGTQGQVGDAIYKRLRVANADLDPFLNAGARYFVEAHFVSPNDAQGGNDDNNASYREAFVTIPSGGGFDMTVSGGVTERQSPALQAWQDVDPGVTLESVELLNDGVFHLASKCTDLGGGVWHYEYALYNMNSHRSARAFRVPFPLGTNLANIEFVDVDYHSGEPYAGTDWTVAMTGAAIEWSTDTFVANSNANALRWGTTYNFAFDADAGPGSGPTGIGLFRAGSPSDVQVNGCVPATPLCPVQNFCFTSPNSNGAGAVMSRAGSTSVSANDLALHTNGAATSQPGLFFYGPAQIQTAFGNGLRCVGSGGVGSFRLNPPVMTDATGDVARPCDYAVPPMDAGAGMISAGTTQNFQFWYRDPLGGGAGFNLSDGLSVTFCP